MTNRERLMQMSDKEIASILTNGICKFFLFEDCEKYHCDCTKCATQWLNEDINDKNFDCIANLIQINDKCVALYNCHKIDIDDYLELTKTIYNVIKMLKEQ